MWKEWTQPSTPSLNLWLSVSHTLFWVSASASRAVTLWTSSQTLLLWRSGRHLSVTLPLVLMLPWPMLLFLSPNSLSLLTLFELCDKHIAADLGTDSCIQPISNMPGKLTLKKTSRGQLPHSIKNTATNGLLVYKYN